jgi:hypothetical protein
LPGLFALGLSGETFPPQPLHILPKQYGIAFLLLGHLGLRHRKSSRNPWLTATRGTSSAFGVDGNLEITPATTLQQHLVA